MTAERKGMIFRFAPLAAAAFCALLLSGCTEDRKLSGLFDPENPKVIDRPKDLTRADYANLLDTASDPNITFKTKGDGGVPVPDLAPILTAPEPPKLGKTKLVSIAVTDDVPLKDVLLELSRLAEVDIEVDANITGGISFRAKDKPFNEVIERIASVAGLRYKMEKGVLRVERDTPHLEVYPIDFLNIDRSTTSSVSISTNVLSSGGGSSGSSSSTGSSSGTTGGSGGLNTGSQSSITAKSDSDFWQKFEDGVKQIIAAQAAASSTAQAAAPAAAGAPAAGGGGGAVTGNSFYILNRQGATLTVNGTDRQHSMIKRFIKQMEQTSSAQVLIEAKIVEVTLDRQFQSGIDWNKIGDGKIKFTSNLGTVSDPLDSANIATLTATANDALGIAGLDLDVAVRMTERFGTTRTLSSPRLHAINNQQAVLTFAENQVYFQVSVEREQNSNASNTQNLLTVNSEIKTVPIGIILTMQPSINLESGEVTLNVRPTLSRVTSFVSDPAVAYLIAQANADGATGLNVDNKIPVVEVRELDSILKLKSGQVMVIGGLMENKATNNDKQVPFAADVPLVGELFKNVSRNDNTKELVIFIRATILDSNGSAQDADKAIYKKFTKDPRPLEF